MSASVPTIVASQSFVGETTSISQDIYTPQNDELLQVNVYRETTSGSGNASPTVSWTDDIGSKSFSLSNENYAFTIKAKAGHAVHLAISPAVGITYSYYIAIASLIEL